MNMKKTNYEEPAELLKALGHPVRLCIVKGLSSKGRCNVSYMEECMEISQSGISQHLAKLRNVGIVKGYRSGNEIYYELVSEQAKKIIDAVFSNENSGLEKDN
jgi:ArsR family transcriptional regulator